MNHCCIVHGVGGIKQTLGTSLPDGWSMHIWVHPSIVKGHYSLKKQRT